MEVVILSIPRRRLRGMASGMDTHIYGIFDMGILFGQGNYCSVINIVNVLLRYRYILCFCWIGYKTDLMRFANLEVISVSGQRPAEDILVGRS